MCREADIPITTEAIGLAENAAADGGDGERRFREMIDALPAAIYTTDAQGWLTHFNPACVTFSGRTPKLGADRWCVTWKMYRPDGKPLPHDECPMAVALKEGRAVRGEQAIAERPDGTRVWFEPHPTPLRDASGKIVGGINMLADVTERKRTEANSTLLAAIVESSDDAILSKDLNGVITSWNAGAQRIFGYTPEEAVGQPVTMLMPPDVVDDEPGILERVRRGEPMEHFETIRRRKDGTLVDVSLSVSPVFDSNGRVVGASSINRDITERKQAEGERIRLLAREREALAEAEALNNVARALSSLDLQSVVQTATDAATKLIGAEFGAFFYNVRDEAGDSYQLFTLSGAPLEAFEKFGMPRNTAVFAPTFRGEGVVRIDDVLADPRYGKNPPHKGMPPGHLPVRSYLAVPVAASSGEVLGGMFFGHSETGVFTERAERIASGIAPHAAIAIENAQLFTSVKREIAERERAEAALKEINRRKDEFLAILAHELRNPLAPIRNSVQIMRMPGIDSEVSEQARLTVERQVSHMVRLVDDLLDVSRLSRDRIELRRERVALAVIVQSAVETSRPVIDTAGQELSVELPSGNIWLYADLTRMAQVFANLLNNAAKYSPDGAQIRLSAEVEDHEAVVRVRDTGIGIPADMLPHIFEMFRQADTSQERGHGGLGIGLTLVKSLVRMHGGTVEAQSAGPGEGSEFIVRLPLLDARPATAFEPVAADEVPGVPRRILVVDDNRDSALSLSMLLTLSGHETQTAHDGPEALEAIEAFEPDVVLLDIGLPGLSGYEVARQLRRRPDGKDILLVALTGWGQEDDRRRSCEAGFDGHFVKPVDYAALTKLLAET